MSGKLLSLMTTAGLLCAIGTAHAREAARLTDEQLDRVTAGAELAQTPPMTSFLVNGSNGAGGINQFSPSIATLIPTMTNVNLCVFCITTTTK